MNSSSSNFPCSFYSCCRHSHFCAWIYSRMLECYSNLSTTIMFFPTIVLISCSPSSSTSLLPAIFGNWAPMVLVFKVKQMICIPLLCSYTQNIYQRYHRKAFYFYFFITCILIFVFHPTSKFAHPPPPLPSLKNYLKLTLSWMQLLTHFRPEILDTLVCSYLSWI